MGGLHVPVRAPAGSLAVSEFVRAIGFPWHAGTENRPTYRMLRGLGSADSASRTSRLDAHADSRHSRPHCPRPELTGAPWPVRADRDARLAGRYARTVYTRHRVPCACRQSSGASGAGQSNGDLTAKRRGHRRNRLVFDCRHTRLAIPGAIGRHAGVFGRAPGQLLAVSRTAFPRATSNANRLQFRARKENS